MAITTGSPIPFNQFQIISHGVGAITGSASIQDIKNFDVPVLAGTTVGSSSKRLIIEVTVRKTLGAGQLIVYFGQSAGQASSAATLNCSATAANTTAGMRFILMRNYSATTKTDGFGVGYQDAAASAVSAQYDFDISAAETIYMMVNAAGAGNNATYSYSAYIIG